MRRLASRRPLVIVAVFALACALWLGLFALREARRGDDFDLARWELSAVPNKWLHALGVPLRDNEDANAAIAAYFAEQERDGEHARSLENAVEAAIEGRIDAVLDDLRIGWPLSSGWAVLPPIDVELAGPPRVLVVSPRSRIARVYTERLEPDVSRERSEAIERGVERRDDRSALVVPTGGVATYPAIVDQRDSYAGTVSTAAHEWIHHYLGVYRLGRAYLESDSARTINETVADLAGDEIAREVLRRWGDPTRPAPDRGHASTPVAAATPPPARSTSIDTNRVLRDLRLEVDTMLAAGRIDAAEQRMEQVRLELVASGATIRRINQAYFAWHSTYAARPDSIDPLGPQLRTLRERAGSLGRFLELVRDVSSRDDVARALERLGARQ